PLEGEETIVTMTITWSYGADITSIAPDDILEFFIIFGIEGASPVTGYLHYGGSTHNTTSYFFITIGPSLPDFDIQLEYETLNLYPIGVNMTTVDINSIGGFTGTVSLSILKPLPAGISVDIYPETVFIGPPYDWYASALLVVHTNSTVSHPSSYEITIQASGIFGNKLIIHSKLLTIDVTIYSPDCSISEGLVTSLISEGYWPTGIADYGVNNGHTYTYSTDNFTGWAYFTSLDVSGSLPIFGRVSLNAIGITLQLNVVNNVTTNRGEVRYYWVQNVLNIRKFRFGYTIAGFYNVYNCTSGVFDLISRTFFSYGNVWRVSAPFNITSSVAVTIDASGRNVITFSFTVYDKDRKVLGSGKTSYAITGNLFTKSEFVVNGKPRSTFVNAPYRLVSCDAEFVVCGRSGYVWPHMDIDSIDATMFLGYKSMDSSQIIPIPHAFNFGVDTAEAVKNANVKALPPSDDVFTNAHIFNGKIDPTQLW
ncbi:MAG: thermopsin family protease, partial [Fervidobacterium sp.]